MSELTLDTKESNFNMNVLCQGSNPPAIVSLAGSFDEDKMKKHLTRKSLRKGKRKHGFRVRMSSPAGRKVIKRRRRKGKYKLTV